jgi:hypothetical protein
MRKHTLKPLAVIHRHLAIVVTEYLLVQIAKQVERLDANVGSLESALQERPEILKAIGVNLAVNVSLGVVNDSVLVAANVESLIGQERIGIDFATLASR